MVVTPQGHTHGDLVSSLFPSSGQVLETSIV